MVQWPSHFRMLWSPSTYVESGGSCDELRIRSRDDSVVDRLRMSLWSVVGDLLVCGAAGDVKHLLFEHESGRSAWPSFLSLMIGGAL